MTQEMIKAREEDDKVNPLTDKFLWRRFTNFYLTWFCWLPVLQDFTCCHQTYNYSRLWLARPHEQPLVTWNHAHSGALPPNSGWATQFNGVYQVCNHCMRTQSTQLGCSCAWALASTQSRKLVQFMHTQKPHKCYDEGEELHPFKPCHERMAPPCAPPCVHFSAGVTPKNCTAVHGHWPPPKVTNWCSLCIHRSHTSATIKAASCTPSNPATRGWHPLLYILVQGARWKTGFFPKVCWWFSHFWTIFWESCRFSNKWNRLWRKTCH